MKKSIINTNSKKTSEILEAIAGLDQMERNYTRKLTVYNTYIDIKEKNNLKYIDGDGEDLDVVKNHVKRLEVEIGFINANKIKLTRELKKAKIAAIKDNFREEIKCKIRKINLTKKR